jgi:predicted transglutaminase-like cysteine proteinase
MVRMMEKYLPALRCSTIGARCAAMVAAVCLLLPLGQAQAMGPLIRGFPSVCAVLATAEASTVAVARAALAEADPAAIPDDAPSKLELLRAEQTGFREADTRPATPMSDHLRCVSQVALATSPVKPALPVAPLRLSLQSAQLSNSVDQREFTLPSIGDSGRPDVFGSVALAVGKTPLDQRWNGVRDARVNGKAGPWSTLLRSQRGRSRAVQIETVNTWVNARISFVDDIKSVGISDQWASAAQTLRKGRGDCEDYAIAKMQLLRSLGVDASDLYLVIARDLVRQADHAMLVVRMDGQLLLLDNGTDHITDARSAQDYRPIMSYSGNQSWFHGYQAEPGQSAAPVQIASLP